MPELVAFAAPPSAALAARAADTLVRGDAVCFVDHRLSLELQRRQVELLDPTWMVDDQGESTARRGGTGVEVGDAVCCLTSGSSGTPKVAVLTLDAVLASAERTNERAAVDPASDGWLSCLPWAHIGGMAVLLRSVLTDTRVTVLEGFDADAVEAAGRDGLATHTSLVLTALRRIDPSVFSCILLGGAAPPPDRPANVVATYGMTETGSGIVYDGIPLRDVVVAADPVTGELLVQSPTNLRTYRNAPSPFVVGPDGTATWLATGDAGSIVDGVVSVVGRIDEVIATGGEKVHPAVVERALAGAPGVAEVAVWRRDDPTWGQRVVAFVVPSGTSPVTLESLRDACADLAPWERPKELVLVDALPRTASGKVARRLLS